MTLLLVAAILLNIPIFRDVIVFAYLSFAPGFVILKAFKLKELTLLNTFLISVGLSLAASMFVGFLVNELYIILRFSQPLSIIPLTAAMSTFTLIVFFISYRRDFSINFVSLDGVSKRIRSHLPLTLVLLILPVFSIVGALYVNIPIMIILCLTIAVLCILTFASNKLVPSDYYPFLIFSISISILLLNLLMSKYIIGDDASFEYYVFKVAQIRGYWGPINTVTNPENALAFNSVLSVTVLPNVYSVLMNLKNEILFTILYSFIFSLVPITLYGIYKNETGKLIGLLSAFVFIFSVNAFFGESISVNRQIVGELFLMLSILIWLDKTLPIKEKRILLIIFGASIAVSHYSLAVIYVIFVALVVILSSIKPKFDNVFNASTLLAIFGATFLWEAFSPGSTLDVIINTVNRVIADFTSSHVAAAGSVSSAYAIPTVFTAASWINLILEGAVTLSLVIGILIVILFSKRMEISDKYKWITIFSAILLAVSFLLPSVASTLNFTRLYGISLLFLSPCVAIGALSLLKIIQSTLRKRNKNQKNNIAFLNKHGKTALLLVAVLLSAYFLSQVGFINYVTEGAIRSPTFEFEYHIMETSNNPQIETTFSWAYIQEQEAFSADWLSKYAGDSSIVYADASSAVHVLVSRALIPENLIQPLTNVTSPEQGQFVYLDNVNVAKGIIPTLTGYFNTSEISSSLNESNLIYSNGNSAIWSGTGSG
jgi:uncharacterized membrane protein